MPSTASSSVRSRPSTPEPAKPASVGILSEDGASVLHNYSRKNGSNGDGTLQTDSNVATPSSSSPHSSSMSRSSTQNSIQVNDPPEQSRSLPQPTDHSPTTKESRAPVSNMTEGAGELSASKPTSEDIAMPSPPPTAAAAPSPSVSPRTSMRSQRRALAEMPSVTDIVVPPKRPGLASGSPSSHSIASSIETVPSSTGSGTGEIRHRFERLPQGGHRHHLCAPRRHQFLASQVKKIRDFLDGKKDDHHANGGGRHYLHLHPEALEHPMSLLNEKYGTPSAEHHQPPFGKGGSKHHHHHDAKADFVEKYGELQQVVGKGAFGTVRISMKKNPGQPQGTVYAIKEFKNSHGESQKAYMRRLTSEFCIASSLKHINVIQTLDLLQLHNDTYSEVMEYCAGGDLHSLIASADTLGEMESSCFFAQLINGVAYLHSMGVVHRDIKPENLLLTSDGCLKIADFGNSEVFRMPWEKKVRTSVSIRGSGPFIAPEEFTRETFDARKVDIWACGIVYMCMRLGRYTWYEASEGDPVWDGFLYKREKILEEHAKRTQGHLHTSPTTLLPPLLPPPDMHVNLLAIEQAAHLTLGWPEYIADVIEHILEPEPRLRWQAGKILDSEWFQNIENCHPTERPEEPELDETELEESPSHPVGSRVILEDAAVTGCKVVKDAKQTNAPKTPPQ